MAECCDRSGGSFDLAYRLKADDPADIFVDLAGEYLDIARESERRALLHAKSGDTFVAYDEAMDVRWALGFAGVAITAWLATLAGRADYERRRRLDCTSTEGEQLSLGEEGTR